MATDRPVRPTQPSEEGVPSVSGTLVTGLFDAAREKLGRAVVDGALASLPAAARAAIATALPGAWVPLVDAELALGRLADAVGRDVAALHEELARANVERTLRTVWRLLLRFTSDEALVSRTPVIFSKAYNRGRLVPRIPQPGRGEIELVDWPRTPDWPFRGTKVGIEMVLTLAGRQEVRVEGKKTATGAAFVASWRSASGRERS